MRALTKTTWVELKLFTRDSLTVLFTFAIPFVVLFVLGSVFGNHSADPHVYRGFGILNYLSAQAPGGRAAGDSISRSALYGSDPHAELRRQRQGSERDVRTCRYFDHPAHLRPCAAPYAAFSGPSNGSPAGV